MKQGIVGLTSLGLLVAVLSGTHAGPMVASAAAGPTPVALQYDEIVRIVIPTATPPPPGSFLADYQTIVGSGASQSASDQGAATGTPSPAPHRGGLGDLISSALGGGAPNAQSGAAPNNPYAGAANAMMGMMSGHLVRYAYYHNWIRTDDVVGQTATISKCDVHQFITLDLAKHTYTMSDTSPKSCPSNVPMMGGYRGGSQQQEAPGTADMTISGTATNLGPLTIDGISTTGSSRALSMTTTNATGSCKDSSMSMDMVQYVSQIVPPRPYCPITHSGVPQSPTEAVASGGCKPRMHVQSAGAGAGFGDSGRQLVMYLRMNVQGGTGGRGGMSMVTQRGNVKWLYTPQAQALFSVPPGFTQSQ
jgi:hypothetical protein